jgi:methionyl-tRNA formyltransferase
MQPKLVYYPDPMLRERAQEVRDFSADLNTLADSMRQIMKENNGMGLAAPQVGDPRRIIVVEYFPLPNSEEKPIPFTVLINPEVVAQGNETDVMSEGCLSVPYVEVEIERPTDVTIKAYDVSGKEVKLRAKGLFARIVLHEIDHLNGKLILDYDTNPISSDRPRAIVWGSTAFTTGVLNILRQTLDVTHIVTEPPKPSGRKQELTPTATKQYADMLGIPTIEPTDLQDPRIYNYLLSLKPEIMIVAAYGRLIPESLYTIPTYGTLNVHPSLLPKYRGATPIQAAILAGDTQTGVTIMQLAPSFDTGAIIAQAPYDLDGSETYGELEVILSELGGEVIKEILPQYLKGELEPIPQDDRLVSKTTKISLADRWLDMRQDAVVNERKVRAYAPEPGAFVIVRGQTIKVLSAHIENNELVFDTVQPAGKKPMKWGDFLRGYRHEISFDLLIDESKTVAKEAK